MEHKKRRIVEYSLENALSEKIKEYIAMMLDFTKENPCSWEKLKEIHLSVIKTCQDYDNHKKENNSQITDSIDKKE